MLDYPISTRRGEMGLSCSLIFGVRDNGGQRSGYSGDPSSDVLLNSCLEATLHGPKDCKKIRSDLPVRQTESSHSSIEEENFAEILPVRRKYPLTPTITHHERVSYINIYCFLLLPNGQVRIFRFELFG